MIAGYAFLAIFTVQILTMSVLQPVWFIRYCRMQAMRIPAERLAQLYPGVDLKLAGERLLNRYRALSACLAVLGVVLLGWSFGHMRRPDWNEGPVLGLLSAYSLLQWLPILFVGWLGVRFNKQHKNPVQEGKRKATLRRRGLFDFVSPFAVCLAILGYLLFAAFVIYVQQRPSPGFALIGALTLAYAASAFHVYWMLYGRKSNPLETPAGRAHTIGSTLRSTVYSCIACVVFFFLIFTLVVLNLDRWQPFAISACVVSSALLSLMGLTAPPREPEADGIGPEGQLTR